MTAAAGAPPLALAAAAAFAVDPAGLGGILLEAGAGPLRERWWAALRTLLPAGTPVRRLPPAATDDRLVGGLDLAATLAAGRPILERGLLADADGGVVVVPMAERLAGSVVGHLVAVLDQGTCRLERDGLSAEHPARVGLVLLDEREPDEAPVAAALRDRVALVATLAGVRPAELELPVTAAEVAAARARLAAVAVPPDVTRALAATALRFGVRSPRATVLAQRVACAFAALEARAVVEEADGILATQLVLLPRATQLPAEAEAAPPDAPPPPAEDQPAEQGAPGDQPMADRLVEAALAELPPDVLAALAARGTRARADGGGRSEDTARAERRGRAVGTRRGDPRRGRLDLLATLRAAAPWQRLRGGGVGARQRLAVRADDLQVRRLRQKVGATVCFAVDASGSQAVNRLAEAKGAVELLLAESYVRRDRVALVVFRGTGAELVLPPTRSLTRAKRALQAIPGGGGTPLATGLDALGALARTVARGGGRPVLVILTDGRANVARDGTGGRERAQDEALAAARQLAADRCTALLIDASPRPNPFAAEVARAMGGRYLPLPSRDPGSLAGAVRGVVAS